MRGNLNAEEPVNILPFFLLFFVFLEAYFLSRDIPGDQMKIMRNVLCHNKKVKRKIERGALNKR